MMKQNRIQNLGFEVSELPEMEQSLSPTPSLRKRRRVTFNSTYQPFPVHESCVANEEKNLKTSSRKTKRVTFNSNVTVYEYVPDHESIESFLPANEEETGDSDLGYLDGEDDYFDDDEEDINIGFLVHQVWTETLSNSPPPAIRQQVESPMPDEQPQKYGRNRSDCFNSLRNPVQNILQWKAAKSKGPSLLKPLKENSASFGQTPSRLKTKSNQLTNASLLSAPSRKPKSSKNSDFNPVRKPVENILQWKGAKAKGTSIMKPQKANSATFEAPRLSVGQTPSKIKTKSNGLCFKKTCVMELDKRVKWHSTPFETRLDRALNRGVA